MLLAWTALIKFIAHRQQGGHRPPSSDTAAAKRSGGRGPTPCFHRQNACGPHGRLVIAASSRPPPHSPEPCSGAVPHRAGAIFSHVRHRLLYPLRIALTPSRTLASWAACLAPGQIAIRWRALQAYSARRELRGKCNDRIYQVQGVQSRKHQGSWDGSYGHSPADSVPVLHT